MAGASSSPNGDFGRGSSDHAKGYSATGNLTVSETTRTGSASIYSYRFKVAYSDGNWLLESDDDQLAAMGTGLSRHIAAGTDGKDVYIVATLSSESPSDGAKVRPAAPKGQYRVPFLDEPPKGFVPEPQGYVTTGSKPRFDENLQLLWFALLSGRYLQEHGVSDILPFWRLAEMNYYRVHLERCLEPPALPAIVNFVCPEYWYDNNHSPRAFSAPYQNGFIAGDYRVNGWTNFAGLRIPIDFEFRHIVTPKAVSQGGTNSEVTLQCRGRVTGISVLVTNATLPDPPANLTVTDYRFREEAFHIDSMHYKLPKDGWQRASSKMLSKRFAADLSKLPVRGHTPRVPRVVIVSIMLVITTVPIVWLILGQITKSKTNKN